MQLTEEQKKAVYTEGHNLLISAGAGSGKTAVLSKRIVTRVVNGADISRFIVLTFTKKAASEMKERIISGLKEAINSQTDNQHLKEQVILAENAQITTFDSYAQMILRKFYYLTNLEANFQLLDEKILQIKALEILDPLVEEELSTNKDFAEHLKQNTNKAKNNYQHQIYQVFRQKEEENIFDRRKNDDEIKEEYKHLMIKKVKILLAELQKKMQNFAQLVSTEKDQKACDIIWEKYRHHDIESYDQILTQLEYFSLPVKRITLDKESENADELRTLKEEMDSIFKKIKAIDFKTTEEIAEDLKKQNLLNTALERIYAKFNTNLNKYKQLNNSYTYADLARKFIALLKNNPDLVETLKAEIDEIYVDEYQDTNHIQEEFLNLVQQNNLYMVGDAKQAIYRFRNADPKIFQTKFMNYLNNNGGEVILLNKNFRSNYEVITNINEIFSQVMTKELGEIDYDERQQLILGREKKLGKENYFADFLLPEEELTKKEEIEMVVQDIIEKIETGYQINENGKFREATYRDFAIITPERKNYTIIEEVFQDYQVPVIIDFKKKLFATDEIYVLKNGLAIIALFKYRSNFSTSDYYKQLRYSLVSLSRSFIYKYDDSQIYNDLQRLETDWEKNIEQTIFHTIITDILQNFANIKEMTLPEILHQLLDNLNLIVQVEQIGKVTEVWAKIKNFEELLNGFEEINYDLPMVLCELEKLNNYDLEIEYSEKRKNINEVEVLNIHQSKGLQFKICYFMDLETKLDKPIKNSLFYKKMYGFYGNYVNEELVQKSTLIKEIVSEKERQEILSEKIRIFYVALTRAEEKIIFVNPFSTKESSELKSYQDILRRVTFADGQINYHQHLLKENKKFVKNKTEDIIKEVKVKDYQYHFTEVNQFRASKSTKLLLTEEEKVLQQKGTEIHEKLETIDFTNLTNEKEKTSPQIVTILDRLAKFSFVNSDSKYYQEYYFIDENENIITQGIIDLLIETDDQLIIIDYKLSNIDDEAYDEQIKTYRNYLTKITEKKVRGFLFSLNQDKYREINFTSEI